jgi:putative flippase GtrA
MKDSVVSGNVDEFSSVLADLEKQAPLLATARNASVSSPGAISSPANPTPSYQPYPWPLLNGVLDFVDKNTNGRAGWLQRFISYLLFGGLAALVNLLVFYTMNDHVLASFTAKHLFLGRTLSYIAAAELSILANFIPNDRFTFNTLPGAQRPWLQRCGRFHMTTAVGSILTYLIMMALTTFTPVLPIIAEAIATLLVLVYNFSFHHIFTYRHVKHA